ncbi:MAG: Ig-like domain repeat protein, partial [Spirochaetales bacterium]|nr:Ig-like domain repeat protein [Spirochaetales bacterium]
LLDENPPTVSIVSGPPATANAAQSATQNLNGSASDGSGSGIASYSWTVTPGGLAFGSPTKEDTTVYDPNGSIDNAFELRLTVADKAGRSSYVTRPEVWDRTPLPAPASTGAYYDTDYPAWSRSGAAADLGYYQRGWDESTWTSVGASTSYEPPSLPDYGPYTLQVRARDDAGNTSSSGSRTIYYFPNYIYPYWGQRGVALKPPFNWPDDAGAEEYDFFIWSGSRPPTSATVPRLTVNGYTPAATDPSLAPVTSYSWYYKSYDVLGKIRTWRYTSPTYSFMTAIK